MWTLKALISQCSHQSGQGLHSLLTGSMSPAEYIIAPDKRLIQIDNFLISP